jgi:hypothetical protein
MKIKEGEKIPSDFFYIDKVECKKIKSTELFKIKKLL